MEILREIDTEIKSQDLGYPREQLKSCPNPVTDLVTVIQGLRRSGKSTFMRQWAKALDVERSALFVNFEDPRLADQLDHKLLDQIVRYQEKESPDMQYYFLDEIQNVKNWEKWLHTKLVARKKKSFFIVTGSNAVLLGGKLGTALTGRHVSIEIFPFSFSEYMKVKPANTLDDFFDEGGMPRALTYERPDMLLREYFTGIIERDVRRHVAARSTITLVQMAKAIFESTGSELSLKKLAPVIGISDDTAKVYVTALLNSYLIGACPYFTFSERKRMIRPVKYYPCDLGMMNSVTGNSRRDIGKKLETYVYQSLRKKFRDVYYWRKDHEVDFVINTKEGILPIQVSLEGKKERHEKAFEEFSQEFPQSLPCAFISRENADRFIDQIDLE